MGRHHSMSRATRTTTRLSNVCSTRESTSTRVWRCPASKFTPPPPAYGVHVCRVYPHRRKLRLHCYATYKELLARSYDIVKSSRGESGPFVSAVVKLCPFCGHCLLQECFCLYTKPKKCTPFISPRNASSGRRCAPTSTKLVLVSRVAQVWCGRARKRKHTPTTQPCTPRRMRVSCTPSMPGAANPPKATTSCTCFRVSFFALVSCAPSLPRYIPHRSPCGAPYVHGCHGGHQRHTGVGERTAMHEA
jgi:hypothetical protein